MWLAEIWRFPVKSMSGEQLQEAELTPFGIPGDRVVHAEDSRGRVLTSRSKPKLLLHHARLGADGEPYIDGLPWSSDEIAHRVRDAAGPTAHLVRYDELDRFDILPLLVLTDGAAKAFGHDSRRLRANLLISGVPGLAERTWEGQQLRIGDCIIDIADLRERCIMTTFDPDTAEQNVDVLKEIHRRFEGTLALNCSVSRPGRVRVGDGVELIRRSVTR